ncbi:MAG: magnesium transporter [Peptostreptococcaceae bacterium]|nr:magnesium transporter [Peptostreptococcaceae bacterium]MDY5739361.1 magnesium transporter [Anaerovoracaceae bacterium]SFE21493.1 magnesium transporter [Peptostreptococcaceae bacterium pGA-8]
MDIQTYDFEEIRDEVLEKILRFLSEKKYFKARDELLKLNVVDIAYILEEITEENESQSAVVLFRLLPKDVSVDVFAELPLDDQVKIVNIITDKELEYILQELDFDDKIDVLEELPANVVDKILEKTPKNERNLINTFLNYPDNCAGTLMTPDYISLQKNWTVAEALQYIKREGMDAETIYTCYVKDRGRKLIGIVSLSTLVISDDDVRVNDIMRTDYIWESVYDDREDVAADFRKYGFLAIPVVDNEHRLVGIITVDDILDVIEEETTEDFERMNGVLDFDSTERKYLDTPVFTHVKNRLPWLLILMLSYILTGGIITRFEKMLSSVIALVSYMPMLMGTAGNTGSQAATLIIRGLATDEVDTEDAIKILFKEFKIGAIIGIILSAINFLRIIYIDGQDPLIAMTVCASMLAIVIFAKALGSMIPVIAKLCKVDPALIANPAISSISDTVSCLTYFTMAALFLGV